MVRHDVNTNGEGHCDHSEQSATAFFDVLYGLLAAGRFSCSSKATWQELISRTPNYELKSWFYQSHPKIGNAMNVAKINPKLN